LTRPEFSWRWDDCPDGTLRYVLLEHRRSFTDHHLDLMIEIASGEDDEKRDLLDIEFNSGTCFQGDSLNGRDHGLHRRIYLWFEGEIGHVGGSVKQLASGECQIREIREDGQSIIEFTGEVLAGSFAIQRLSDGAVHFERIEP